MRDWLSEFAKYKDFYGPFSLANDLDYYDDLRNRFKALNKALNEVNADKESIHYSKEHSKLWKKNLYEMMNVSVPT